MGKRDSCKIAAVPFEDNGKEDLGATAGISFLARMMMGYVE